MSYLTQMAGLAYHNFVSAAVGIALAIALIRGFAGDRRGDPRQLLGRHDPCDRSGCCCRSASSARCSSCRRAWCRTSDRTTTVELVDPQGAVTHQVIAQGPVASQEVIKKWGTNGGGFFNANSAHPFENPTPLTNFLSDVRHLRDLGRAHRHARPDDEERRGTAGRSGRRWRSCSWPA